MYNQNYPRPIVVKVQVGWIAWDTHLRWNPVTKNDPIIEFHADGAQKAVMFEMRLSRLTEGDEGSLSRAFEQRASGLASRIQEDELKVVATREAVTEMLELEKEPWAHKDELVEKHQRLTVLVDELEREQRPATVEPVPQAVGQELAVEASSSASKSKDRKRSETGIHRQACY